MSNPSFLDKYSNARDNVYNDLNIYLGREPTEEEVDQEIEERKE